MKILLVVLIGVLALSCKEAPEVRELQEARSQLELLQGSNDKLSLELGLCQADRDGSQARLQNVCMEVESFLSSQMQQAAEVSKDSMSSACGVSTQITKLDDAGWVYLKYDVGGDLRYSDRLWFKDKQDRNTLLVHTGASPVLLSVESCVAGNCRVSCQVMVESRNVCKQP